MAPGHAITSNMLCMSLSSLTRICLLQAVPAVDVPEAASSNGMILLCKVQTLQQIHHKLSPLHDFCRSVRAHVDKHASSWKNFSTHGTCIMGRTRKR